MPHSFFSGWLLHHRHLRRDTAGAPHPTKHAPAPVYRAPSFRAADLLDAGADPFDFQRDASGGHGRGRSQEEGRSAIDRCRGYCTTGVRGRGHSWGGRSERGSLGCSGSSKEKTTHRANQSWRFGVVRFKVIRECSG